MSIPMSKPAPAAVPHRRCSRRARVIDGIMGSLVISLVFAGSMHIEQEDARRAIGPGAYVLGIVGALALLLWRRRPVVMVVIVAAAMCTYLAIGYPPGPSLLPGPISLLLLGLQAPRRVSWSGAVLMAAAVTVGQVIGDGSNHLAIAAAGWSVAAVLAGQLGSTRRDHVLAERERRRLQHRQAVTDERLRIAQDLHDSVAHAMATITVQAGTAAHLLARSPDRIDAEGMQSTLAAIRTASAEVLDELGAILGVLRRDPESGEARAELQPQAGLDRIGELVDRARADGVTVTVVHAGDLAPGAGWTAPAGAAAYRLVQEALSNVRQHAGVDAQVRIEVTGNSVTGNSVSVVDDGGTRPRPVAPKATPGFGLIGMRERVEASGGTLSAGPGAGGRGFQVVATWPTGTGSGS